MYKRQAGDSVEKAEPVYMFPTLSEFNLELCALSQAVTVGGEDVDTAVSYTHLDVYKRQCLSAQRNFLN